MSNSRREERTARELVGGEVGRSFLQWSPAASRGARPGPASWRCRHSMPAGLCPSPVGAVGREGVPTIRSIVGPWPAGCADVALAHTGNRTERTSAAAFYAVAWRRMATRGDQASSE